MKKALTIGLATAAIIAGGLSLVTVDNGKIGAGKAPASVVTEAAAAESEPAPVVIRMAQLAVSQPYLLDYERGPRIIHVPQPNERTTRQPAVRASVERRPEPAVTEDDDAEEADVVPPPPPRPRAVAPKPRMAAPPPDKTPRWKLRSDTPAPPPGPRRAVLSAPPPSSAGPTPLRPTPRFDAKAADAGEKFATPAAPRATAPPPVTETQPPLGYSPPATPAPETPADEQTAATPSAALPED